MKKTATVEKVFRKDKMRNGKAPLHIRVTKFRRIRYIATGISVDQIDWNENAKTILKTHRKAKVLNHLLNQVFLDVEEFSMDFERRNIQATAAEIKAAYLASKEDPKEVEEPEQDVAPPPSFMVYLKDHIASLQAMKKLGTLKKAKNVYSKLGRFLEKRCKKNDLLFCELDHTFLGKYESYLKNYCGNSPNTIYKEMSLIRALFNAAISDDNIAVEQNQYPFRRHKLKWEKTRKKKLREPAIEAFFALVIDPNTKDWHIRNMFLFAIHSGGMRISDLLTFQVKHLQGQHVRKQMFKTDTRLNFLTTPKGRAILEHYITATSHPDDFVFPFLDSRKDYSDTEFLYRSVWTQTAYFNKRLKILSKRAGLSDEHTSHVGRGTWITRSVRKGMPLDFVQGTVGHTSRKTTEGYLDLDQDDYDNAVRAVYGE